MRRLPLVLLLACSSSTKQPPIHRDTLGSAKHETPKDKKPAPNDGARAFRLAYADPGGMWIPEQMLLPQHIKTFTDMGVKLDAKALADPLAEPLAAMVSLGGCT